MNTFWHGCIALVLASTAAAAEPEEGMTIQSMATIELTSSYAWRGEVINDEACFQPSLLFEAHNIALKVWGTWDLHHTKDSSPRTRMDVNLYYNHEDGDNSLRPGFIAYVYNDDYLGRARDTFEVFLQYSHLFAYADDRAFIPAFCVNYDFDDIDGVYASVLLMHNLVLVKDKVDLDFYVNLGWATKEYVDAKFSLPKYAEDENRTFEPGKSALLDLTFVAELPMPVSESAVITPRLKYMHMMDSEIRDALDDADEPVDDFGGSISVAWRF